MHRHTPDFKFDNRPYKAPRKQGADVRLVLAGIALGAIALGLLLRFNL